MAEVFRFWVSRSYYCSLALSKSLGNAKERLMRDIP